MGFRFVVLSVVTAVITGCAGAPTHSDFLGDMSAFKKAPNGRDAVYWVKPGLTGAAVSEYTAVIIEPVSLTLSPTSEHKGIRADEAMALCVYFREALVTALQDRYPVVDKSGPHVLRIRPAIAQLHRDKPISPLEFTPVGLALTGVEAVTGMPSPKEMLLGPSPFNEASVEMAFSDSASGDRLVAFKDTRKARREFGKSRDATWGEVKELLDEWASDVRRVMDHPHMPGGRA
jgi:hypothetical protein